MEFAHSQLIVAASPEAVWRALHEPEILRTCIPDCEHTEKLGPGRFGVTATWKFGPLIAVFKADIRFLDPDPPHRFTLQYEVQGGIAGFGRGNATILLEPVEGGTVLSYSAQGMVGGKLAQLGGKLVGSTARQLAAEFFQRFSLAVPSQPIRQNQPLGSAEPDSRDGIAAEIWMVGLIGVIVVLLVTFGVVLGE